MKVANINWAGVALMASGYGLACVSGGIAYDGLVAKTGLALFGLTGPLVALAGASAGIAAELHMKARKLSTALVCAIVCIAAGAFDFTFGEISLTNRNDTARQAHVTASATFATADRETKDATRLIADREAQLTVLAAPDVKAAQRLLGVIQDGEWGRDTTAAKLKAEATFRSEIADARKTLRDHSATVAKGAPIDTHAEVSPMFALAVTGGAIVLSFLGSLVAFGMKAEAAPGEVEALAIDRRRLEMERQQMEAERAAEGELIDRFTLAMNGKAAEWEREAVN